jgi:metacaspase-1
MPAGSRRISGEEEAIMAKKAFCVGINDYPGDGNDLKGCVNDAHAWANLLIGHYDFPRSDVKVLTDAQATRQNVLDGLKILMSGAGPDDVLVFTNSSHGSYEADTSGDEPMYDELLCPYDVMENVVLDDELRELFAALPAGARLTVVSDSCFSGTVTRATPLRPVPDDRRVRFFNPRHRGSTELRPEQLRRARTKRLDRYPESQMKEILLSAASDRQYATDALIEGTHHGAMTFFSIRIITASGYQITYRDLQRRLRDLVAADYSQDPQLEGTDENKRRPIFT